MQECSSGLVCVLVPIPLHGPKKVEPSNNAILVPLYGLHILVSISLFFGGRGWGCLPRKSVFCMVDLCIHAIRTVFFKKIFL